jgi:hypothetical protein
MNFPRIALAALGAFVAYFAMGGLAFAVFPLLAAEFRKYPAVYRSQAGIKSVMPAGMAAMFVAMLALAVIYAMLYRGGSGITEGARFGALIGVFAIGAFVVHNYVKPEYRAEADPPAIRGVPGGMDCDGHGDRANLQAGGRPLKCLVDLTVIPAHRLKPLLAPPALNIP